MREKNKNGGITLFTGADKVALLVIFILASVNYLINEKQIAAGILTGGVLFIADFIAIRLIVSSLTNKTHSPSFTIFLFVIKMLILLFVIGALLIFAKLNIYGFFIALTAAILVIAGSGLKGNKNGTF